jgi:hypothetical protein
MSDRNDFVYENRAGEGVFVYVIDTGVQVDVKNVYKAVFHIL